MLYSVKAKQTLSSDSAHVKYSKRETMENEKDWELPGAGGDGEILGDCRCEDEPVPDGPQGKHLPGQGSPGTSGHWRNQNRNRKASSFPRQRQVGEEGWARFSHPCTVLGGGAGGWRETRSLQM